MSRTQIKAGLKAWVTALSGLTSSRTGKPAVSWRDEPDAHTPDVYALISMPPMTVKGTDGVRHEFDAESGQLIPSTHGNRLFTLTIDFRGRSQKDGTTAADYAERVQNRIAWPRSQAMLRAFNVAFVRVERMVELPSMVDQRAESRAVLDLRMSTRIRETDGNGGIGYFTSAELESTYTQPGAADIVDGPVTLPEPDEDP